MFNYDIYEEPHLAENPRRRMSLYLRKKATHADLLAMLQQRMKVERSQILLYRLHSYEVESFGFHQVTEEDMSQPLTKKPKGKGKSFKAFNIDLFYVALRGS
jgi:hypothetical protein